MLINEPSGFAPVSGDELISINGGIAPVIVVVAIAVVGLSATSCNNMMTMPEVNDNARLGECDPASDNCDK